MNIFTKPIIGFALPLLMLGGTAQAVTVSVFIDANNDCGTNGYFSTGTGFSNCAISFEEVQLSPVIAKFDSNDNNGDLTEDGISTLFPTIDGDEWEFGNLVNVVGDDDTDFNISGTWIYTPDDDDDPDIRYWTAKASTGFNLFWDIGDAAESDTCMEGGAANYNLACLSLATAVTTGDWETPNDKGLSHLTFFDSVSEIPVPAAFWLFGTALIGFIGFSRRTKI